MSLSDSTSPLRRLSIIALAMLCALAPAPSEAAILGGAADAFRAPPIAEDDGWERIAQGGCSAAAAQAAAQTGGQVLSVTTSQQGGRTVCVVTVLIPGRDGSRPRRQTITVPQ